MDDGPAEKIRVAIVGGGCAGIAAAWALSHHPDYEIHVYEKSWRLGGKGASVRSDDGRILEHGLHVWLGFYENAFRMMRECYAEVERRKWGPNGEEGQKLTHGRIEDAFYPELHAGVADPAHRGGSTFWSGLFPPGEGLPGEPLDAQTNPFTIANYLGRCFGLLKTLMLSVAGPASVGFAVAAPSGDKPGATMVLIDRMASFLRVGALTGAAALAQAISILEVWVKDFCPSPGPQSSKLFDTASKLIDAVARHSKKLLADLALMDPEVRMKAEIIDIVMTIGAGLIREKVLFDPRGLDAINDVDYYVWLKRNGATDIALNSRFLVGAYDFVFGYRNGNRNEPALAAGVALRGAFRMFFTYRGAMIWRMASGMGDAIFAPLYKVLQEGREIPGDPQAVGFAAERRMAAPVIFHFLHELERVVFDRSNGDRRFVTSLDFRTPGPAETLDEQSADALDVSGAWPKHSEAKFPGSTSRSFGATVKTISQDFHRVVLALGVEDLAGTDDGRMAEAIGPAASPTWTRMFETKGTVATKAAQVWLRADRDALGWDRGSGIVTGLGRSFSSWGDMTLTLAAERRSGASARARSVHYFCDVLPEAEIDCLREKAHKDGEGVKRKLQDVAKRLRVRPMEGRKDDRTHHDVLRDLLNMPLPKSVHGAMDQHLRGLLEKIARLGADPGRDEAAEKLIEDAIDTFDHDLLNAVVDRHVNHELDTLLTREMREAWPRAYADGRTPVDLEVSRHVQANILGSERYSQSLPGSLEHRISPLDRSAENMTIAGDWTACGLDMGCVEAAVMSGLLAAHATSGTPERHKIIGFDHP